MNLFNRFKKTLSTEPTLPDVSPATAQLYEVAWTSRTGAYSHEKADVSQLFTDRASAEQFVETLLLAQRVLHNYDEAKPNLRLRAVSGVAGS